MRDPRATVAALARIGIVEAELYGLGGEPRAFGVAPAELRREFEGHGIRLPVAQIDDALERVGIDQYARGRILRAAMRARPDSLGLWLGLGLGRLSSDGLCGP
ncbi:MAG TPA: hypothetical protein VMU03_08845 [Gammaproteobacteria bacterium]|nr:hypothetical protein [Gammaproteobacteria bacterium]